MHRLPSKSSIFRFRLASLLLWVNYLIFVASVAALVHAFMERSREKVEIAILLMGAFVASVILQWLVSLGTKCPLCITPVLVGKSCSKNKKAKTFFGSYRLRVANNVLFRNYFRCPYCSEPTELVVRTRRGHHSHHRE